jgi:hypothetical protein
MNVLNRLIITATLLFAINGPAQTNSWTKPTSGDWHEPFWSLGVLPDASQSHIMFTNAGWKALAITRITSRDFPDSLNIPRLTVASPTNTVNTLLLNYAGVQSPLRVADFLELGSNAFLVTLSSAIEVGADFFVDGTVTHGDNSQVSALSLYVGDTSPGVYNFSNGMVSAGSVIVGDGTTGSFEQSGGRLSVSGRLALGQGDRRTFTQGNGRFELMAGTLTASTLQIGEVPLRLGPPGADGTFIQSGGSNFAGGLRLGGPESDLTSGRNYTYILNDGVLMTSNTVVYGGNGNFAQAGGLHHVDGPLALAGFYGRSFAHFYAQYTLTGGVVTARSLNINFGAMSQSAGTNQISGDLIIGTKQAFARNSFYNLSGGSLSTSNTIVSTNGGVSQSGGSATAVRINVAAGEYSLTGGDVAVSNVLVGDAALASFRQSGGRLAVSDRLNIGRGDPITFVEGTGRFELTGGTVTAPTIQIGEATGRIGSPGADGSFVQSGGSNFAGGLLLGEPESFGAGEYTYTLNNGLLVTSNTFVHGGHGHFIQAAGLHQVDGPLHVTGFYDRGFFPNPAQYTLSGGVVRAHSLTVGIGDMFQSAGTNEVAGDLVLRAEPFAQSAYSLSGGRLSTSNTRVFASRNGGFTNSGGTHVVGNLLDLELLGPFAGDPPSPFYTLSAGELIARDIRVSTNGVFRHTGGTLSHSGTLALAGGTWQSAPGEQPLGVLRLDASSTNSSLLLTDPPTVMRFANSAATPWHAAAALVIHNWRGSTNGGGSHRIHFGNSASGLTLQQLGQIRFRNPMGLAAGDYTATILNTGEIIPLEPTGRGPAISYQRSPGQLRMEWPLGYTLQTATNILGPFEDLNASSPHSVDTTAGGQRFFRFRQSETP